MREFLQVLGEISGHLWLALIYKFSNRLLGPLAEWFDHRDVKRDMGDVGKATEIEIRELLPAYLGRDIKWNLQQGFASRIVLMMDTYEDLWRDTPQAMMHSPRTDAWVRRLLEESSGALVTIFSRNKLHWADMDKSWEKRIEPQHLLGGLSNEDASRFLEGAGITKPAVRQQIVVSSHGLPFYLDLAVTHYEQLAQKGPVNPEDFADIPTEWLYRFVDHLTDTESNELRLASYPVEISEALFTALAHAFPGAHGGVNWRRFRENAFVEDATHGAVGLHALMREGLQALERKERFEDFRSIHLWLHKHYDREAQPSDTESFLGARHDRALIEACRHIAEVDRDQLVSWILGAPWWQKFYDAGRYLALCAVLERASHAVDGDEGKPQHSRGWEIDHHLATAYQLLGRYQDAKILFKRADDKFNSLEHGRDPLVYATILHAQADVCRELGEEATARGLYERALDLYDGDPKRYEQRHAEVLLSLGSMFSRAKLTIDAERYFRLARAKATALGGHPPQYAEFIYRLAYCYYDGNFLTDAAKLFEEALAIYSAELGERHQYSADCLLYVSSCVATRDRIGAERGFAKVVSIYKDALGLEHPKLGRALHFQVLPWAEEPTRREMAVSQLKNAVEILRNALGADHDWTKHANRDLLRLEHAP